MNFAGSSFAPHQMEGKNWRQVNNDVASRMMAASSDSPPVIPKRDYDESAMESPGRGKADSDDSEWSGRERGDADEGAMVLYQPPPQGHQADFGSPPIPVHPPPIWPPDPPFLFAPDGMPMMRMEEFYAPPPFLPPPPHFVEDHQSQHKRKKKKKAVRRSRSMEMGGYPMGWCPPPPFPFPPPPPQMPPPGMESEADNLAVVPFNPQPPLLPPPSPFPPPFMMHPPPSPMSMPMMNGSMKPGIMNGSSPQVKKPFAPSVKKQKHSTCYLICCRGHTQVLWIIIGIILVGVVVGLVLGLTLV